LWPHYFNLTTLKGLGLLIIFHLWLFAIGPKMAKWQAFENFGFAVLVLDEPTFACSLMFLISTHFKQARQVGQCLGTGNTDKRR